MAEFTVRIAMLAGNRRLKANAWRWMIPAFLIAAVLLVWFAPSGPAWAEPADDAVEGSTQIVLVVQEAGAVDPVNPSGPDNPVNPSDPDQPTTPTNPDNPNQPTNPTNPTTPTNPDNPVKPADPSNPVDYDGDGTIDKNDLTSVIADAEKIIQGDKSDETYQALVDAIKAARAVLADPNASESEIAAAIEALEKAADEFFGISDQQQEQQATTRGTSGKASSAKTGDSIVWVPIVFIALAAAAVAVYSRRRTKGKGFTRVDGLFSALVVFALAGSVGITQLATHAGANDGGDLVPGTLTELVQSSITAQAEQVQDRIAAPDAIKIIVTKNADGTMQGSGSVTIENNNAYFMRMSKMHVAPIGDFSIGGVGGSDPVEMSIAPRSSSSSAIDAAATTIAGGIDPSGANLPRTSPWISPGLRASADNSIELRLDVQALEALEPGEYPMATLEWGFEPVVYHDLDVSIASSPRVGRPLTAVVKNAPTDDENDLTFAWYVSDDNGETWTRIEGADSATYIPDASTAGKTLRVEVGCSNGAWYEIESALCVPSAEVFEPSQVDGVFTVEYVLGEHGANPPAAESVAKGAKVTRPEDPTDPDWAFNGWFVDEELTAPWRFESDTVTADLTLHAKWTEKQGARYIVTHYLQNADDDDYTLDATEELYGTPGTTTQAQARTYENFQAQDFAQATIAQDEAVEVRINYNRVTHTVAFDENGRGATPDPLQVRHGGLATAPNTVTAPGYTVERWTRDKEGMQPWDFATDVVNEDTTLYAQWKPITYTLKFDANEGEGEKAVQQLSYDAPANLENTFTREGFTFTHWNTKADGTGASYLADQHPSGLAATEGAEVTLYAQWAETARAHTVTFVGNAEHGVQVPSPQIVADGGKVVRPDDPIYDDQDHLFAGWYKERECETPWSFADDVVTANVTLYAKWLERPEDSNATYKVEYYLQNLEDDEYTLDDSLSLFGTADEPTAAEERAYEGFALIPFEQATVNADNSTVVKVYYNRSIYIVSYDANNHGKAPAEQRVRHGASVTEPTAPEEAGWRFDGWFEDDAQTAQSFPFKPEGSIELTAHWSPRTDVAYVVNHRQQNVELTEFETIKTDDKQGTTGQLTDAQPNPYEGFTALGYQNVPIAGDGSTVVSIDYKRHVVTVAFDANGGDGAMSPVGPIAYDADAQGSALPECAFTRAGFTFDGWNTQANGEGDAIAADATAKQLAASTDGAITLYAQWKPETYTVTFDGNGQDITTSAIEGVAYGATVNKPADPTADGYAFNGWYRNKECTQAFSFANNPVTENITLYAKWTPTTQPDPENPDGPSIQLPSYKVNHYLQLIDTESLDENDLSQGVVKAGEKFYQLEDAQTLYGAAGEPTAAEANGYEGFTALDFGQKEIAQEGTTEIDIYYDRAQAAYVVKHLFQATTGDSYIEDASMREQKAGTVGAQTEAAAQTVPGFAAPTVVQQTIASNGSTVVEIRYDRTTYPVTFETGTTGSFVEPQTVRHGALATRPQPDPTTSNDAWLFDGWYADSEYTSPWAFDANTVTGPLELHAKWIEKDNPPADPETDPEQETATYFVNHYLQLAATDSVEGATLHEGAYYRLDRSDEREGNVGAQTAAEALAYAGYEAGSIAQQPIAADGSTHVDIYYARATVKVAFDANDHGTAPDPIEVPFGGTANRPTDPSAIGWAFEGWLDADGNPQPFPFSPTTNITLKAKWAPDPNTPYKVNHYLQVLDEANAPNDAVVYDGKHYVLQETDEQRGTTGHQTEAQENEYEGFTHQAFENAEIAAAGTTEVNIYYSRHVVNITLDPNGGLGSVKQLDPIVYDADAETPALPQDPKPYYVRDGYDFVGWNTAPDGQGGHSVTPDATAKAVALALQGNVTLYAQWAEKKYTVTFDANGHGTAPDRIDDVSYGATVNKSDDPADVIDGDTTWHFNGWYREADCQNAFSFTSGYITEDITLYAKWTEVKTIPDNQDPNEVFDGHYTVNHWTQPLPGAEKPGDVQEREVDGITYWLEESEVLQGQTGEQTQALPKAYAGFVFQSYSQESISSEKATVIDIFYNRSDNVSYTVKHLFQAAVGTGYLEDESLRETKTGTTGMPTEASALAADGFTAQEVSQLPIAGDGSTIVEVRYDRETHEVTFETAHGSADAQTVRHGAFAERPQDPAADDPSRYFFNGWYKDAEHTQPFSFANEAITGDITLHALWTDVHEGEAQYTVNHYLQLAEGHGLAGNNLPDGYKKSGEAYYVLDATQTFFGVPGQPASDAKAGSYDGFKAKTFTAPNVAGDGSTVVDIFYDRATYTVSYNANGHGEAPASQDVVFGGLATRPDSPEAAGWTFEGWFTDANCSNPQPFPFSPAGNIMLYAKWAPKTDVEYKVEYWLQSESDPTKYEKQEADSDTLTGTTGELTQAQARAYAGFTALAVNDEPINGEGSTVVRIEYARHVVNISFSPNGADSGAVASLNQVAYSSTAATPTIPGNENGFVYAGHAFSTWNTQPDGQGTTFAPGSAAALVAGSFDGDVTLYAQWEIVQHIVTFNMNDHGSQESQQVAHGGLAARPANLEDIEDDNDVWHFNGWYKDENFVQAFNFENDPITADTTIYAKWTKLPKLNEEQPFDGRYTVNHWVEVPDGAEVPNGKQTQEIEGVTFYLEESEVLMGQVGMQTAAQPKYYVGFSNLEYGQTSIGSESATSIDIFYVRANDTPYTVKHLLQTGDGAGYAEDASLRNTLTGTTGTLTDASPLDVEGFQALDFDQKTILGGGTTEVEIRYDRIVRTVSFDTGASPAYVGEQSVRYGAHATRPADPAYEGHLFEGWYADAGFATPWAFDANPVVANMTLYAKWAEPGDSYDDLTADPSQMAPYKVNHYIPLAASDSPAGAVVHDGKYYKLDRIEERFGVVGQDTHASPLNYSGLEGGAAQQKVLADGSTKVDIYYNRATVRVTFDANGHGRAPNPVSVPYGESVDRPATDPTDDGYVFGGWYKTPDCHEMQAFPFAVEEDTTLYAKWTAKTYIVSFEMEGHGVPVSPRVGVEHGSLITAPSDPVDAAGEYVFNGWYWYVTPFGENEPTRVAFSFATDRISADTKLYAKWTKVGADPNGQYDVANVAYKVRHLQEKLDQSGYDVVDVETLYGKPGDKTQAQSKSYAGFTATSVGEADINGDGSTVVDVKYGRTSSMHYTVRHLLQDATGTGFTDAADSPEGRVGTTGATTQATMHHYAHFISPTLEEVSQAQKAIAGDGSTVVTLRYYRMSHEVQFDLNADEDDVPAIAAQTVRYGATATAPANPQRDGYTFDGWYADAECTQAFSIANEAVTSDLVLYAKWVAVPEPPSDPEVQPDVAYTVRYYLQPLTGSTPVLADETTAYGKVGETASPNIKSYAGFTHDTTKTMPTIAQTGTVAEVYYNRISVTVAYDAKGHGTAPAAQAVPYGTQISLPESPTEEGWFFRGWFADQALMNQQVFPFEASSDITLRAKWTGDPNTPYKVLHQKQGYGLNSEYETVETENKVGTAGEQSEAHAKTYPGFTAQPITQVTVEKDAEVAVKYDRHVVNVTYDANGGEGTMSSQMVTYNDSSDPALTPNAYTYDGHQFVGWNTHADGSGKAVANQAPARDIAGDLDGDITLYAQWQATGYTVAFDMRNHGTPAPESQLVAAGALVARPSDPADENYEFAGWYKNDTYTQAFSFATDAVNQSMTLYAKWNPKNVDPESGQSIDPEQAVAYRVEHYQQKLGGAGYDLVDSETLYGIDKEETKASAKTYDGFAALPITQQVIDGSENAPTTVVRVYYDRGAAVSYTVKHLKQNAAGTAYVQDGAIDTLTGVAGGTTMAEARDYGDTYEVQPFSQKTIAGDGSTVVEIQYKCMAYEVEFDMNGHGAQVDSQRVLHGGYVDRPAEPTEQDYVFNGWFKDSACTQAFGFASEPVTGEFKLYAKWTEDPTGLDSPDADNQKPYTVNHYLEVLDPSGLNEGNLPAGYKKQGEKFYQLDNAQTFYGKVGDYTTAIAASYAGFGAQSFDQEQIKDDGSTTVNIFYNRGEYTVSFNANGHGTAPTEIKGSYGTVVNEPSALAEQGYEFGGWFTNENLTAAQSFPFPMTQSITLYAKWTSSDETPYKVEHKVQALDLQSYELDAADVENLTGTTGTQTAVQPLAKYATGFDAQEITQQTIAADGQTTVEVKYDRHSVNVSFDPNGATGHMNDVALTYGEALKTLPACAFTRTGYQFTGWNTEADGSGTAFMPMAPANSIADTRTGSLTLYAQWQPETYTVSYNMHNRGTQIAPQTGVAYGTTAVRPSDPVEDGWSFDGWYADAEYTTAFSFATDYITANTTLHAHWVEATDGQSDDPSQQQASYQVNHLQQTVDQAGYVLAETTTGYGVVNHMTTAQAKSYGGFTAQAITQQQVAADGSTIVEVRYNRNADTTYTVKHLLQNASGYGYTEDVPNRQTQLGIAGGLTSAQALTYAGMKAQDFDQKTIAGNGQTVIEIHYDRDPCTVTFDLRGKGENFQVSSRAGAYVSRPAAPEQYAEPYPSEDKWSFEGWYVDEACTQAWDFGTHALTGDTTIYAHWIKIPADPVWYTIEYYQESYASPDTYTLVDSTEVPGANNANAEAIDKAYQGFTLVKIDDTEYQADDALTTTKQLVRDGEKVTLKMYYKRNTYNVTLKYNGHGNDPDTVSDTYRFAHMMSLPVPEAKGYTFGGWRVEGTNAPQTSPMMVSQDITLVAQWAPKTDTVYKVRHMLQQLDDLNEYSERWVEVCKGTTDAQTQANARLYEGYDYVSPIAQSVIAADGSTVVEIKYNRKNYQVTFDYQGHGGTSKTVGARYQRTLKDLNISGLPAENSISEDGYRFSGWFTTSACAAGPSSTSTSP